jgi:hypothetical protein
MDQTDVLLWIVLFQILLGGEEVLWTRDEPWGRADRTCRVGRTCSPAGPGGSVIPCSSGTCRPHLQGRPDQVVRPCLAHVTRWFQFIPKCVPTYEIHNTTGVRSCLAHVTRWFQFLPKCVPTYEIHNTTRGTLLVLKETCHTLLSQNVVRTVNSDQWLVVVTIVVLCPLRIRVISSKHHPVTFLRSFVILDR